MNKKTHCEDRKDCMLFTNLTDAEYEIISYEANAKGMNVSEYIRSKLFASKVVLAPKKCFNDPELARLIGDIGHMQGNLRQIAEHLERVYPNDPLKEKIYQCIAELFVYKMKILEKAGEYNGSTETRGN